MTLASAGVVVRQVPGDEVMRLTPATFDVAPIFDRLASYTGVEGALFEVRVGAHQGEPGERAGCAAVRYEAAGGEKGTMHIDQFVVLPNARGHGVGTRLMRAVLGHAREMGIGLVRAEMPGWCPDWRAFYARFGFVMTDLKTASTGTTPVELRVE